MLISTIFFNGISEKKRSLTATILIGSLFFEIGAAVNIFIISTVWLNVLISVLANIALALTCFNIKKQTAVFYSVLLVALSTFIELILIFTISVSSNLYVTEYKSEIVLLVIEVIISKVIFFFITLLLHRFSKHDTTTARIPVSFYFFPLVTLIAVISFWYVSISQYLEFKNQIVLSIISVLLMLVTLFIFFSYQTNAQKENRLLFLQQEQDKLKTDITYYEILERQNNNLRAYAHDTKNHLSVIKNLNTNPEIEMHISQMSESLAEYSKVCHSGNHTLDVVVDKYVTECQINGLNFKFDIKNNNLSTIELYDIVTILGNLLDNALEAANNSAKKIVSFETDYRNNFSVIIVSNSCDTNPMSDGKTLPATTKSNKHLHGFGLKSVKKTVKKYNGDIAFDYDENNSLFIVTVMIGK